MSVNITVNGKFTKQTILDDPERVKKELETKRRTMRLQQVRAQSKELARKIRNDVSQEKEKQLRNLEAVKAQELNCWRENVLAQKCHDYQKSINEVGQAHKAAKDENSAKILHKNDNAPCTSRTPQNRKKFATKTTSLPQKKVQEKTKHKPESVTGKRMQVCFDGQINNCNCISKSDSEDEEKHDSDCTSSTLSSGSSLDHIEINETICKETEKRGEMPDPFQKTITIENQSTLNLASDKNLEISELENNFELSPKKSTVCTQTGLDCTSENSKTEVISTLSFDVIDGSAQPRYTKISELIAKQKDSETNLDKAPMSPKKNLEKNINSETTSKTTSPKKSAKSAVSRLNTATKSSAATIIMPGTNARMASGSDSSSRVQYYDYRNKFSREYTPPAAVAVAQDNHNEPNAMERANMEKTLQKKREEELTKLRQKSEERGQRALEKEQVRRECVELTEKLEALTQNQNLLPSDAHLHNHQYYAIKAARKESKLNGAIEELLSRPAIITCPDVQNEKIQITENVDKKRKPYDAGDLNLGATSLPKSVACHENLSSDSSGTILLGYMDDRGSSKPKEIAASESKSATDIEKVDKLQKLLKRIEHLRGSLIKEIDKNEVDPPNETAQILEQKNSNEQQTMTDSVAKKNTKKPTEKNVPKRAPEKKPNERAKPSKEPSKAVPSASMAAIKIVTSNNEIIEHQPPQPGQPLEIVIKLKSETSAKKSSNVKAGKATFTKKIRTEYQKSTKIFSNIPPPPAPPIAGGANANRRTSYDSNSTAYRPLPVAMTDASEQFVKRMKRTNQVIHKEDTSTLANVSSNESATQAVSERPQMMPCAHLNPLIAQYVERLLAMSRESVNALEVSSSDIETPSSSIVHTTANRGRFHAGDSLAISEDHVQRVERFITDNRSFIDELEESFRTHSNESLETSLRRLEEAWKQKFCKTNNREAGKYSALEHNNTGSKRKTTEKLKEPQTPHQQSQQKKQKSGPKQIKQHEVLQAVEKRDRRNSQSRKQQNKPNACAESDADLLVESQTQLQHYAELTKNCSTRIAELTALITKVREEKQRLLEVTLTSASENERNSTEYRDLPVAVPKSGPNQEFVHEAIASGSSISSNEAVVIAPKLKSHQATDKSVALPLEKNKKTGQSRDSGISMLSRPVTAMGNDNEYEPQSLVSSIQTSTTTKTTSSVFKKPRPPPALATQNRHSPLTAEDEIVHELSTIVEVETPATSRLNTSTMGQTGQKKTTLAQREDLCNNLDKDKAALRFPTFDEYVRINNLDLTTLDHEQSLHMELEYNELIGTLKKGLGDKVVNYDAFPTLSAYLQNLTTDEKSHSPETFDELFECLRLTPVAPKPFPSHQEYIRQTKHNLKEVEFAANDSVDNTKSGVASGGYTGTDSDTIDIERELQRRNILKGSFRSLSTRNEVISLSSSGKSKKKEKSHMAAHSTAIEVDMNDTEDKPNTSESDGVSEKFQQELRALGLQWPQTMRKKEKQAAALNSPTSSSSEAPANDKSKQMHKSPKTRNKSGTDHVSDSESTERPLNLRDFLTRQLLKHATATSSSASSLSGDSLRSQFFLTVLDSMTPSETPRTKTNTATTNRNEPQKTSTPVPTHIDDGSASNSTPLFSNESHTTASGSSASARIVRESTNKKKNNRRDN